MSWDPSSSPGRGQGKSAHTPSLDVGHEDPYKGGQALHWRKHEGTQNGVPSVATPVQGHAQRLLDRSTVHRPRGRGRDLLQ